MNRSWYEVWYKQVACKYEMYPVVDYSNVG